MGSETSTLLQLENDRFELRHHLAVAEVAEVAAVVLRARIFGVFFGELSKISALIEFFFQSLGLVFGLDQNMSAPILPLLASKA